MQSKYSREVTDRVLARLDFDYTIDEYTVNISYRKHHLGSIKFWYSIPPASVDKDLEDKAEYQISSLINHLDKYPKMKSKMQTINRKLYR